MSIRSLGAVVLACGVLGLGPGSAHAFDTAASQAIMIDAATGIVLFEKNADEPTYPASMTKIMTMYVVFSHLTEGTLALDDELPVSRKAWRMQGSKMFVEVGSNIPVEALIRGVIVQSGNDAAIVLAEGLSGSEQAFAHEMTQIGRDIGMTSSNFVNASGWPDPEHVSTVRDMALVSRRTIEDFPQLYHYYAETEFTWSDIEQNNRNPLLYSLPGTDGLKTGYTQASGYGLAASAERDGRRLILVVNGLAGARERATEAQRVLAWGFREFETYRLFEAGDVVADAEVWLGREDTVPLFLAQDLDITITRAARRDMTVKVVYEGPVAAPIASRQPLARLVVEAPGMATFERPLLAGLDVPEMSLPGRMVAVLGHLLFGPSVVP